jgi:hypothetical protein
MATGGASFVVQVALAAGVGFVGTFAFIAAGDSFPDVRSLISGAGEPTVTPPAACNIKGNISIETGERIYHMPYQRYYPQTRISPQYGERWFCSEGDARAAGWRKSKA